MSSKTKKRAASRSSHGKTRTAAKTARPGMTAQQLLGQFFPDASLMSTPVSNTPMEGMMTKSKASMDKLAKEASSFGREGMEALVKSGTIFTKGMEEIMRTGMTLAQTAAEKQSQLMKQAMASKSLTDFAAAQNKLAQSSFDDFMATTTKISEMSVRIMNETAEPISEQMTRAMKKASEGMAA